MTRICDGRSASRETAREILTWLQAQRADFLDLLERLVRVESPSHDLAAQQAVLAIFEAEFARLDFVTQRIAGRHLYARPRACATKPRRTQLMIGHCDTVWPHGTLAHMPLRLEAGRLHGPGVYDMKAGLTQIVFALRALAALQIAAPLTPVVLINSDEEIGSHTSTRHIRRLARMASRAFVLEPASGDHAGLLKTARKGIGRFTFEIEGRAAHAGVEPEKGVSAIHELAYLIPSILALQDPARQITLNVGEVTGGTHSNVVAAQSRAVVDVRVASREDARRVEAALRALEPTLTGAKLAVRGGFSRLPMEKTARNAALWELARERGEWLGLALQDSASGGASDGNTTSLFAATLDGLGAVGDGAHANHEFVYVDRLAERAALLALLIAAPAQAPT